MRMPPLSAEQMAVVDGTEVDPFWARWIDRRVNHNDRDEDGNRIIRDCAGHYVFLPEVKDPTEQSFLGFGGRRFKATLADGTVIESNNVWFQGQIPLRYRGLLPDNAEGVEAFRSRPVRQADSVDAATLHRLSGFEHPTLAVDFTSRWEEGQDAGGYDTMIQHDDDTRHEAPLAESHVWTSEIRGLPDDSGSDPFRVRFGQGYTGTRTGDGLREVENGWHTVMLDIDMPVRVVPSSTEGHCHLYIDKPMPWWRYRRLLRALKAAGIIEPGYYSASIARRATHLRLPWVQKEALKPARLPLTVADFPQTGEKHWENPF